MKFIELLEVLNANVYFHLFEQKHIGRFNKFDLGIKEYLNYVVKEISIDDEILEVYLESFED